MPNKLNGAQRKLWLTMLVCLSGCASVGPDYRAPEVEVAKNWQAALPHGGKTDALLGWWNHFNDPVLTELLNRAETDNPTLDEAVARIDEARAGMTAADAGRLPVVNGSAKSMRNNIGPLSEVPAQTSRTSGIDASWEIDIFGRVRRSSEAADARLEMLQDGWHSARVSLAAEVASKYVNYRACQLTTSAFERDEKSRQESARITEIAAKAGLIAPADAQLARASFSDAALMRVAQQAACDITVKSLVTLTGFAEPELRSLLQGGRVEIPQPAAFAVDTLPVALLAQRPDLAASERELAAASAEIGVAAANRYPRLSLFGNLSTDKTRSSSTTTTNSMWSFGPALSLPLFNGGALAAQQDAAQARYEQALARYRRAIRGAVEEVETVLINLDSATRRAGHARAAAEGFNAYFKAAETNWRAGGISLLALEDARRSAAAAERGEIALQRDQVLSWISLYKALGGGWGNEAPAAMPAEAPQVSTAATAPAASNASTVPNAANTANAANATEAPSIPDVQDHTDNPLQPQIHTHPQITLITPGETE